MNVKISETDNALIIKLEGEMMLGYEANEFHEAIKSSLEKKKKNVVIDLNQVKFITSWGIGILIHGYTTATNGGISFKLAAVPEKVKETFRKIKIDSIFKQYNSIEDALKS